MTRPWRGTVSEDTLRAPRLADLVDSVSGARWRAFLAGEETTPLLSELASAFLGARYARTPEAKVVDGFAASAPQRSRLTPEIVPSPQRLSWDLI